jgi:hypothetical protein
VAACVRSYFESLHTLGPQKRFGKLTSGYFSVDAPADVGSFASVLMP